MTAASTEPPTTGPPTKGNRTRQRLLDAAAAEVARHGRAGASLSAIAAAAGLKPGSIYFHFGSRGELIDAMLEEGVRESLARLDQAMAELTHPPPMGPPAPKSPPAPKNPRVPAGPRAPAGPHDPFGPHAPADPRAPAR
jgi:AcrR family transcriptional regulator